MAFSANSKTLWLVYQPAEEDDALPVLAEIHPEKGTGPALFIIGGAGIVLLQVLIRIDADEMYGLLDLLCLIGLATGSVLSVWTVLKLMAQMISGR
jgi:hypothetical protein